MKLSQIILSWRSRGWKLGALATLAWIVEAKRPVRFVDIMTGLRINHFTATEYVAFLVEQGFATKTYDGPKASHMGKPCCLIIATELSRDILSRQSRAS